MDIRPARHHRPDSPFSPEPVQLEMKSWLELALLFKEAHHDAKHEGEQLFHDVVVEVSAQVP